jgi:glyoxylase-like metal-dependent hydrolase (beta-lactamase superfamily II)
MSPRDRYEQRPYGPSTRRSAGWAPKVRAGKVDCWRCGKPIAPGAKSDLGACQRRWAPPQARLVHPGHGDPPQSQAARRRHAGNGSVPRAARPEPANTVERWSRPLVGSV